MEQFRKFILFDYGSWNHRRLELTGLGMRLVVMKYPELKSALKLAAHTANVYCIEFDPTGKYELSMIWAHLEILCCWRGRCTGEFV